MGRFLAGFGPGSVQAPIASESCKQQLSALAPGLLLAWVGCKGPPRWHTLAVCRAAPERAPSAQAAHLSAPPHTELTSHVRWR